jgi:hypothetical protein
MCSEMGLLCYEVCLRHICPMQRWYLIAVWPPFGVVFGACTSFCCLVCFGGWAVCSVGCNSIGDEGAAAIADGLKHVPSLTRLKYVCVDDRVWESVRLAGYSWGWVLMCAACRGCVCHVCV